VLLCMVMAGLAVQGMLYGKGPPTDLPGQIANGIITAMFMVPSLVIFKYMFIIGSGAKEPPTSLEPPPPSIERETAYQRQLRMAHQSQMARMNPIQKALYIMKNPGAADPPDPEPSSKKSIPILIALAYFGAIAFNLFCGFIIIMYGALLDPAVANEWLIMGLLNVLVDWFVMKPLQFLVAATVAFILIHFAGEVAMFIENVLVYLKEKVRVNCAYEIPLNCRTDEIDMDDDD